MTRHKTVRDDLGGARVSIAQSTQQSWVLPHLISMCSCADVWSARSSGVQGWIMEDIKAVLNAGSSPFTFSCFVFPLNSTSIKTKDICVLTSSHFTGFHGTASPPPLLHPSLSPLPLLVFHLGEFNLVLALNQAPEELNKERWRVIGRK